MRNTLILCLFVTNSVFSQTISLKKIIDYDIDSNIESVNIVKNSSRWINVYPNDIKIPSEFEDSKLIHTTIDYDQVVYQSCNGEIWRKSKIIGFIDRWGLDTIGCSPNYINSFINGAIGKYNGHDSYILDKNNNLDLTDEEIHIVSDSIDQVHEIVFERFIKDQIVLDTVNIKVTGSKLNKDGKINGLKYKICEYRKGTFKVDNETISITLFPGDWYLYHKESKIQIESNNKINQEVSINQYFKHKNKYYLISNIEKTGYNITIKEYLMADSPTSNQIGYIAPDFQISDSLCLKDLRGNYVYLYFWNIDCGACEYGLPKKYEKFNTEKYKNLEIVLVSVDKPKETDEFLAENNIVWRNVKTLGNSKIFNDYDILGYPNTYFIDKSGIILEKGFMINIDKYFE